MELEEIIIFGTTSVCNFIFTSISIHFFKSYGIATYLVSHSHWFETDGDWRKMEVFIDADLHKAIHQVLLEHGWL